MDLDQILRKSSKSTSLYFDISHNQCIKKVTCKQALGQIRNNGEGFVVGHAAFVRKEAENHWTNAPSLQLGLKSCLSNFNHVFSTLAKNCGNYIS